jgi:hypothetical protein
VLRIYDCAQNRSITPADRIRIDGVEWAVENVLLPDCFL